MNFLGMGPMELVLIMVLALIVFGPGKLPEVAGQVGRMVRDFRRATGEMSSEFNKAFSLEPDPPSSQPPASAPMGPALPSASSSAQRPVPAESVSVTTTSSEHPAPQTNARQRDLLPPY